MRETEKERERGKKSVLKGKGLEPKYNKKKTGLNTLYKYDIMWLTVKMKKKSKFEPSLTLVPFLFENLFPFSLDTAILKRHHRLTIASFKVPRLCPFHLLPSLQCNAFVQHDRNRLHLTRCFLIPSSWAMLYLADTHTHTTTRASVPTGMRIPVTTHLVNPKNNNYSNTLILQKNKLVKC